MRFEGEIDISQDTIEKLFFEQIKRLSVGC